MFCWRILATQLVAIGIVTDSTILVVGAMAVGPEFGPLAALAVAIVRRQWKLGRRAALALSVISGRSAALTGVFISVTTVPAAGFVAVALVLGEFEKAAGSALQLALNLVGIVAAAVAVLLFYRVITKRLPDETALRLKRQQRRSRG